MPRKKTDPSISERIYAPSFEKTKGKNTNQDGIFNRDIKIKKGTTAYVSPEYRHEILVDAVHAIVGIGKDHTAHLIMTKEAFDAIQSGEKIN